jgi:hypothetical protein
MERGIRRDVILMAASFVVGAVVSPILLYLFAMSLWSP